MRTNPKRLDCCRPIQPSNGFPMIHAQSPNKRPLRQIRPGCSNYMLAGYIFLGVRTGECNDAPPADVVHRNIRESTR